MEALPPTPEHVLVVDRFVHETHAHVRDQGEAEHSQSHVSGGDHLEHRRHADQVGAEGAVGADLGRGLERRPEQAGVDPLADRDSGLFAEFREAAAQARVVGIRQVGELRPPGGRQPASERVQAGQVDVVGMAAIEPGGRSARSEPAAFVTTRDRAPSRAPSRTR